jgi:hypothetical protein
VLPPVTDGQGKRGALPAGAGISALQTGAGPEGRRDSHELAHVLGREDAHEASSAEDGQRPAPGLVGSREDTLELSFREDGEVVLEAAHEVLGGVAERAVGRERAELGDHGPGDRDPAESRARDPRADDDPEDRRNEGDAREREEDALTLGHVRDADPGEEEEERRVDVDADSGDLPELQDQRVEGSPLRPGALHVVSKGVPRPDACSSAYPPSRRADATSRGWVRRLPSRRVAADSFAGSVLA